MNEMVFPMGNEYVYTIHVVSRESVKVAKRPIKNGRVVKVCPCATCLPSRGGAGMPGRGPVFLETLYKPKPQA
jgi:hypothetical protein